MDWRSLISSVSKETLVMSADNQNIYFGRDLEAMSFAENYHNWIIDEYKPYLGANVAEVGAGTGNFTELLLASETQIQNLVSYEPSSNMFPLLEKKMVGVKRVKIINAFFSGSNEDQGTGFDSVVYTNVLEHVEHDEQELRNMYSALKPGGYALIFVPALGFLYSEFDRKLGHYRRYHKAGLVKIALEAGFKIEKVKYFDLVGIVPWYIAFVLFKSAISGNSVSLYDKLVIPVMRKLESLIAPPIGKNLLLIAKKE